MTCCVAALCSDGKVLILVADKMVGIGFVEAESEIKKLRKIHRDWWVLFAGDDISSVFDVIDYAKEKLEEGGHTQDTAISLQAVKTAVESAFERRRRELAEAAYLTPIGWTLETFNQDGHRLQDAGTIQSNIRDYELPIDMIVAGFDVNGDGCIFTIHGNGSGKGTAIRCDIPGFAAIGSGSTGALYMMYYRSLSPKLGVREALLGAVEAKYFGEQAGGVGESTDVYVVEAEGKEIMLDEDKTVEEKLFKICQQIAPRDATRKHAEVLNALPELSKFPPIKIEGKEEKTKKKSTAQGQ